MSGVGDAFLLGAGASVEAGVPATFEMTERILSILEEDHYSMDSVVDAYKFVVGALIFESAARGGSPFARVDVERVFRAVRLLGDRDELEIAPFVAAWSTQLDRFEEPIPEPFADSKLVDEIRKVVASDQHDFGGELAHAARAVVGSGRRKPYARLAGSMVAALRKITWITETSQVEYLAPIVQMASEQGRMLIGTLNYDNTIETASSVARVLLSGGPQPTLANDDGFRLVKLHGSIDWKIIPSPPDPARLRDTAIEVIEDPPSEHGGGWSEYTPALLFGESNKLDADGPFLDLLQEFTTRLEGYGRLTVVGYSFRDSHVDHAIRRWMNGDANRVLRIVDPSHDSRRHDGLPGQLAALKREDDGRVEYVAERAGTALARLIA